MRVVVTGAAASIGSNLVDHLLASGHEVVGFDDFSTGQEKFLEAAHAHRHFRMVRRDLLDPSAIAGFAKQLMDELGIAEITNSQHGLPNGPMGPTRATKFEEMLMTPGVIVIKEA